jgi:1,4-dihydroxy-2-naphthoate octaprenyltransferase
LRLPSFTATVAPVLIGSSYAWVQGSADLGLVALILVAAICCQAGANLANDYFDHRHGVDTIERPGSSMVIQRGILSLEAVKRGMIVAFVTATILGLAIVARTGPAILLLALVSVAVAVLYTGGPKPLGYVALGEVAVFLTMGLVLVVGTVLALTGAVTPGAVLIALPNALLVTAILHVNNVRDIDRDVRAGKRTLAMHLGPRRSAIGYVALIAAAYLCIILIVALASPLWPLLTVAVTLPRSVRLCRSVVTVTSEADLSRVLRGTNRLLIEFAAAMALGFVAASVLGFRPDALWS